MLSARERLQARLYERLRWQQQELPPIPLADIVDTCVIFSPMRIRRIAERDAEEMRMGQEEMRRRLRSCSRHAPLALHKIFKIEWISFIHEVSPFSFAFAVLYSAQEVKYFIQLAESAGMMSQGNELISLKT